MRMGTCIQNKLDVADFVMRVLAGKISDVVSVAVAKSLKESKKESAVSAEKVKKQAKQAQSLLPETPQFSENMSMYGF